MSDFEKIKEIVQANPEKCPYCFRPLKPKLFKPTSEVKYHCTKCDLEIDLEWDYLHAIAKISNPYLILDDKNAKILDLRKKSEQ